MADVNLKDLIDAAGVTAEEFADIVGVDPKTVQRWRAGRTPQRRHRAPIARALDTTEHELWPDDVPTPPSTAETVPAPATSVERVSEVVATWGSPRSPGALNVPAFLAGDRHRIDVLDGPSGMRCSRGLLHGLLEHADQGCTVRMIIDAPSDELTPLLSRPRIELRAIDLSLVHLVLRADDDMLLGLRLVDESHQPLLQLRRQLDGGLFDGLLAHFDRTWQLARPVDPTANDHESPARRWPR